MAARGTYDDSIRKAIADLTSNRTRDTAIERALTSITRSAVELVDGVDFADVMVIGEGRTRSVTTLPLLVELDALQIELQEGPCMDAAAGEAMVRCTDLRNDARWPQYAAAAVAVGVHSMLSFQLNIASNGIGALNMFGLDPRDVDPAAEAIGALLATLATVAFMVADSQEQFAAALSSRDVIGQAKGMLMNHYKIDEGNAFNMLRELSQSQNVNLRTIARQIVATL
ncbi:GAF and ANTAR domain-containing protein [Mycolicibacterium sediminis]|uniref:ANTAR domain-containing protein n=1 Tax=Mycolicibacterium sediminis TaxID=1286180 RepID=A0A7I7QUC4_9MYCO|nr:GAF and ANTAR domain-containing protein [Mycolicibacterium sediminis]BBY29978.1 hypothetical protein MSEDJ_40740 [Mycolicibacterium sediminis]